jgi:MFS family permease
MTHASTRAEDLPLGRRVLAFAVLMIFEFFYGWCWNTVDVLRPQIRESLGLTLTEAGSAYTAQSLGALAGAVILAQAADRLGRQRTLLAVVIGFGAFAAAGAWVGSYPLLLAQRFGQGFFLGAIFPVLIGLYMGLFPSHLRGKLASLGQGTYNLSVVVLGWALAWPIAQTDWRLILLIGAVPAVVLSPLILLFVPDDRRVRAWGSDAAAPAPAAKLPMAELFTAAHRRSTGLLFLLVGCNFFAYQAFAGWVTTFLKDVRGLDVATTGPIVAFQFIGAMAGGFFWGWFADRYGRRLTALGFFGAALSVLVYLAFADSVDAFRWTGAAWGFMMTASVAWAPWMSELFPVHLRSTAMSIFNWGRLISMTAPILTGQIADAFGLPAAMTLSAIGFGLGGVVWLLLPETLPSRIRRVPVPA